ncbi:MAG: LacI family DNA-binding transcriptional regulator [Treponema sp.]|nr:LacI family DNA-binding transcriptional regulator [Candidatus Treponema equi]
MITIYDIAKVTGYSAPTISKALNGTGGLSEKTREKILKAAESLGYKPNMAARSLTTKKSYLVGVIFEDADMQRGFEHPLFGGIMNTIRTEMENSGYDLIFLSRSLLAKKRSYLEHCHHRNVDAVMIINPLSVDKELMELANSDIPCVSINYLIPGVPSVVTANVEAGVEAGNYLLDNGHKKIGYISGSFTKYNLAARERLEGLKKAFAEHGMEYDDDMTEYCSKWTRSFGYEAMKKLHERHPELTAVFVANDNMAFGAMEYLRSVDIKMPEEISIIGFDDEQASEFITPTLTTFKQNRITIGKLSSEMLMNRLVGIPVHDCVRVPAEFVIRNSVKTK